MNFEPVDSIFTYDSFFLFHLITSLMIFEVCEQE